MAERVVPLHDASHQQQPQSTKRHRVDLESIQAALPYFDAALASLANVPTIGPIAQALRVLTSVSLRPSPDERSAVIRRMRDVYGKISVLKAEPKVNAREIRTLRLQLEVCVEMLLELES